MTTLKQLYRSAALLLVVLGACAVDGAASTNETLRASQVADATPGVEVLGLMFPFEDEVAAGIAKSMTRRLRAAVDQNPAVALRPTRFELLDLFIVMECNHLDAECISSIGKYLRRTTYDRPPVDIVMYGAVEKNSGIYELKFTSYTMASGETRDCKLSVKSADEEALEARCVTTLMPN